MRVYLAAQYHMKAQIAARTADLRGLGIEVVSTWHEEPDDPNVSLNDVNGETLREYAARDLREICECDALVLHTVDPDEKTRRGGRHYESGYAAALGKIVVIVGPRENIFHHLIAPDLIFSTWGDFLFQVEQWQKA